MNNKLIISDLTFESLYVNEYIIDDLNKFISDAGDNYIKFNKDDLSEGIDIINRTNISIYFGKNEEELDANKIYFQENIYYNNPKVDKLYFDNLDMDYDFIYLFGERCYKCFSIQKYFTDFGNYKLLLEKTHGQIEKNIIDKKPKSNDKDQIFFIKENSEEYNQIAMAAELERRIELSKEIVVMLMGKFFPQ